MPPWRRLYGWFGIPMCKAGAEANGRSHLPDLDYLLTLPDEEALAQFHLLLQRRNAQNSISQPRRIVLNTADREAWIAGVRMPLRLEEYLLLEFLSQKRGLAVSTTDCMTHLYGKDDPNDRKIIAVIWCSLRKRLAAYGLAGTIEAVWGFGYKLNGATIDIQSDLDTMAVTNPDTAAGHVVTDPGIITPPRAGQLLVCLFVHPDRQQDRLGDFEELYRVVWVPRFGRRIAACVYVAQAARLAVTAFGFAVVAGAVRHFWAAFGH